MKKLFTFFVGLLTALLFAPNLSAQEYYEYPLLQENFDGWTALPTDWTFRAANSSSSSTNGVFGRSAGISFVDGVRLTGSGSGNRGGDVQFPVSPDSSIVYVDLDLQVAKSTINNRNTFGF